MTLDPSEVIELINANVQRMIVNSPEYNGLKAYVENEQQFVTRNLNEKNAIYIVVKLLQASINFGQIILPITITCVSERNKLDLCQKLMLDYSQTYNFEINQDNTIKQYYTSPMVSANFQEVYEGFRSVMYMSATFVISKDSNPIDSITLERTIDGEATDIEIPFITAQWSLDTQLDTQPYYNNNNFTKSIGKYGTFTLSLVCYQTNTILPNAILNIISGNTTAEPDGMNTTFKITMTFRNGTAITKNFKMPSVNGQQDIATQPTIVYTFTE